MAFVVGNVDKDGRVDIPPSIAESLYFFKDTRVKLGLLSSSGENFSELCVNPYEEKEDLTNLFQLSCVFYNKSGAIKSLFRALNDLGIDVLFHESRLVRSGGFQYVSLVADWSECRSSKLREQQPMEEFELSKLWNIRFLLPTNDRRFVFLIENIMRRCLEYLDWSSRRNLPNIEIKMFDEKRGYKSGTTDRLYIEEDSEGVYLIIDECILKRIRYGVHCKRDENLRYLMFTNTISRTLRMVFPNDKRAERIFSLVFIYDDIKGITASLMALLECNDFSILAHTSSKEKERKIELKIVLEAQKNITFNSKIPKGNLKESNAETKAWIEEFKTKIDFKKAGDKTKGFLPRFEEQGFEIKVGWFFSDIKEDSHKEDELISFSIKDLDGSGQREDDKNKEEEEEENKNNLLSSASTGDREKKEKFNSVFIDSDPTPDRDDDSKINGISKKRKILGKDKKGIIFVSSSHKKDCEDNYVGILKKFLEKEEFLDELEIDRFVDEDNQRLPEGPIERIRQSDFFIGIWSPETKETVGEKGESDSITKESERILSPWLSFEYGVARSYKSEKHCLIFQHEDIESSFLHARIAPNILPTKFNKDNFEEKLEDMKNTFEDWVFLVKDAFGGIVPPEENNL